MLVSWSLLLAWPLQIGQTRNAFPYSHMHWLGDAAIRCPVAFCDKQGSAASSRFHAEKLSIHLWIVPTSLDLDWLFRCFYNVAKRHFIPQLCVAYSTCTSERSRSVVCTSMSQFQLRRSMKWSATVCGDERWQDLLSGICCNTTWVSNKTSTVFTKDIK